jgi:pilus assembly protein FimV
MNRSLKLSMLMALALGTSQAIALDLGQIRVKSALGQPLLAEIPVHPANPAELQNLTVQLASSEEFARAGIVGGRTVIPLHFTVANAGGGKVIRITSSEAVDDPYLDLLLEVNSNAGRSVREFAILLDPPSAVAAAPVAAAPTRNPAARPARPAPAQTAAPHVAAAPKAAPTVSNGQYGPVERGQTLSSIARSATPAGVNAQQMMLALKQANPDAFYRDNINALKSGAILRVPTSAEAQAMTIAAAMAEVRRQNSDWRAGTPGTPAVVADTATRASASSAPSSTASDAGDRLALVQAKDSKNAGGPGNSAAGKGDKAAALRQDLLRSQESLASLQQQSSELKTRLKDMADINSKNEHLLSLKDSEIADLQAKLAASRKSAGLSAAAPAAASMPSSAASAQKPALTESHLETATASTVASANPAAAATSSSVAANTAPAAASTAAPAAGTSAPSAAAVAPVTEPAKPIAKPVTPPAATPVEEQPWYMQTWAWGAGAAAIALLVLLALLGRRRKPAAASSKGASSLADRFGSAPSGEQDLISGEDVDQEELLDQLAEHPDDIGLHLELVTLYYSRRDVEHFEAAAEAMHAHITDPQQDEWQDVMHMGEDLVPGHPLFDHHPEPSVRDEAEARRGFDIDDYADESDAPTVVSTLPPPLPPGAPKKVSEYNFNFDLTKPSGAEPPHAPAAADDATVVAPRASAPEAKAAPVVEPSWHFDDAESAHPADGQGVEEFNDDPIDTKLDLARAYLDMGDADGARAMLGEVMKEGSQMQRDTAKRLLENLH